MSGTNKKLEPSRAGAAHEAEDELRSQRASLLDEVKDFQNGDLKKIEEAIAVLSKALHREAEIYGKLTELAPRLRAAGLDPVEGPEVSRYSPAVPQHQDGTRKVQRSRIRVGSSSRTSGSERYENYEADEPVIIPEAPEFKPPPLFLRIIVPPFHRDGPKYSPANFPLPWYGRDGNG